MISAVKSHLGALRYGAALMWAATPGLVVVSFVLQAVQAVLPLAGLLLLRELIDALTVALGQVDPASALAAPTQYAILLGVVGLCTAALTAISTYVSSGQGAWLNLHVQELVHAQSVRLDLAYFENPAFNDSLHRAQRQGASRPGQVVGRATGVLRGGLTAGGVIVLLASVDPVPLLILMVAFAPGYLVGIRNANRNYAWHERRTGAERLAATLDQMLTQLSFAKEVRAYGLGSHLRDRFHTVRSVLVEETIGLARRRAVGDLLSQVVVVVALIGTLVWALRQTAGGAMTVGELIMYYGALQRLVGASRQIRGGVTGLYEDGLFLRHLREYLEMPPEVAEPTEALPLAPLIGQIRLSNVTFSYPGGTEPALADVSLDIGEGEVVALVGPNGSGKSTLVKLLNRLYDPADGNVHWDGVDIRSLGLAAYRDQFATVFQDFARYPMSASDNIGFGDVDRLAAREDIRQAAKRAGVLETLDGLANGLDTPLSRWLHDGAELSGGEWQRVALARAFFSDAPIVILDEPTAAMDALVEASIFDRFRELMQGRTAVLISHRLASVRGADRIYVLDAGRLVAAGDHDALMEQDGLYAAMFRAQADRYR
ncbi:MAG: ATP-binding cassette domain-containing protein [Acidobacteria bacterium]|nr:ATP-binding cassette domain-containing protein [Acidobacteriota bacterium]